MIISIVLTSTIFTALVTANYQNLVDLLAENVQNFTGRASLRTFNGFEETILSDFTAY